MPLFGEYSSHVVPLTLPPWSTVVNGISAQSHSGKSPACSSPDVYVKTVPYLKPQIGHSIGFQAPISTNQHQSAPNRHRHEVERNTRRVWRWGWR